MIKLFKYLCYSLLLLFIALLSCSIGIIGVFNYFGKDLPDHSTLQSYHPDLSSRVFLKNGKFLTEFATEKRYFVPIDRVPEKLINAFLAAEDKNFYDHIGLDFTGILRSVATNLANIGSGIRPKGASTITQQVARIFFLNNESSYIRKLREAIIAIRIETQFSKDQILELYLNQIFLGLGCYGIAAAAKSYFNKALDELTLGECAYIASLAKGANNYHPIRNKDKAIARRNWVINRLLEDRIIDEKEANAAILEDLYLAKHEKQVCADYFSEEIRKQLIKKFKFDHLSKEGLVIRATLDEEMQIHAENALLHGLETFERKSFWKGKIGTYNGEIQYDVLQKERLEYNQLIEEKNKLKSDLIDSNVFEIKDFDELDDIEHMKNLRLIISYCDEEGKDNWEKSINDAIDAEKKNELLYDANKAHTKNEANEINSENKSIDKSGNEKENKNEIANEQNDNTTKNNDKANEEKSTEETIEINTKNDKMNQISEEKLLKLYKLSYAKKVKTYENLRLKYIQTLEKISKFHTHEVISKIKTTEKPKFSERSMRAIVIKNNILLTEDDDEIKLDKNDEFWLQESSKKLSIGDIVLVIKKGNLHILYQVPEIQGAIIVMEINTGRILAMHSGYSYKQSEFNRATQSYRQVGSLFKPFVYLTALDAGLQPNMVINGADTSYFVGVGKPLWTPRNIRGVQIGNVTMRMALERSVNTVTVKLAKQVGIPRIKEMCKKFGVYNNLPLYLSVALGSFENTLLNMTTAYAKILNGGKSIRPTLIDYVQDRHGKVLYKSSIRRIHDFCDLIDKKEKSKKGNDKTEDEKTEEKSEKSGYRMNKIEKNNLIEKSNLNESQIFEINTTLPPILLDDREQLIDPITVYQMIYMLQGVMERGSGSMAKDLNRILAGKTGTSNDSRDVWSIVADSNIVVGVFVGYDDQSRNLGQHTGSSVAMPIVINFMKDAFKETQQSVPFPVPKGIVFKKINRTNGKNATMEDRDIIMEAFRADGFYRDEVNIG